VIGFSPAFNKHLDSVDRNFLFFGDSRPARELKVLIIEVIIRY
jgi:hypothetical protein